MNWVTILIEFWIIFLLKDTDHQFFTQGNLNSFLNHLAARLSHLFVRNMVYMSLYSYFKPKKLTNDLRANERGLLGGLAGMVGAIASNPFECRYVREVGDLGKN